MKNNALGEIGERKAAEYLRRHGYVIKEKNYRCRVGEIDIIAQKDEFIVFVEVKSRKNASFADAREFVNYSKQQKIIKTAMLWLGVHDCDLQPRFDVVEVYPSGKLLTPYIINHVENAFM